MISPSWGPFPILSHGFWTPRTAPFSRIVFADAGGCSPSPVMAIQSLRATTARRKARLVGDGGSAGPIGTLAVDRWGTAKDQINSVAGTSKSGDKSQILGGIKNSKTGAGRFLAGFWCEQSSYVGCFLQGVDSSSCTTALLRSSLALQKAVR